jgi:hypothetical protein
MDLSSAFRIAANHLIIQINPLTRPRIIEVVLPPMLWFSHEAYGQTPPLRLQGASREPAKETVVSPKCATSDSPADSVADEAFRSSNWATLAM